MIARAVGAGLMVEMSGPTKVKSGAKFTGVPRLLLQHGGPMLPALHHEADLSLHLTMKV